MFKQATVTTEPTRSIRRQAADNGVNASFVSNVGLIERLASLAIGAAVVLIVTRRLLFSFCLAVIGIYLLYRGATGYCPLYASEGIETLRWRPRWHWFKGSKKHEQAHPDDGRGLSETPGPA